MRKFIIVSIILIMTAVLCYAALRLGVSPTQYIFDLETEEGQTDTFTVYNGGKTALEIYIYINDVNVEEDGTRIYVENDPTLPHSLAKWIRVSPQLFRLDPGETKAVKFSILPAPRKKGTKLAAVFVEATDYSQEKANLMLKGRIAVQIQANVGMTAEDKTPHGDIVSLDIDYLARKKQLDVKFIFINEGLFLLKLRGPIDVIDHNDVVVYTEKLYDPKKDKTKKDHEIEIMPGSAGKITNVFEDVDLPEGDYKAILRLDYGSPEIIAAERNFAVRVKASISDLEITRAIAGEPVAFSFKVSNTGSNTISPYSTILIKKYNGDEVSPEKVINIPSVLPDQTNTIKDTVQADLEVEQYTAYLNVVYGDGHVLRLERDFFVESDRSGRRKGLEKIKRKPKKSDDEW
ncbi:hypothetical protein ACFL57_00625 [Candidatus Margulisiibacteriota bacterium]